MKGSILDTIGSPLVQVDSPEGDRRRQNRIVQPRRFGEGPAGP